MFYSLATRPARGFQRNYSPVVRNGALEKFLDETLTSLAGANTSNAANLEDQEKAYSLQLDVPGIGREQLDIGIEGDVVRVSSKADAARSVKAAWRFPLEIDVASSTAKLENGVLTLTLGQENSCQQCVTARNSVSPHARSLACIPCPRRSAAPAFRRSRFRGSDWRGKASNHLTSRACFVARQKTGVNY